MTPPADALDPTADPRLSREELAELVGRAEARRARREAWQPWVLGLGLALLALGLPSERLWGPMDLARQAAGNGERGTGIVFPLAVALHHLLRVGPERACYLIAAACYGLCVPALVRLVRGIGFGHGQAMAAAVVAVASPVAWVGATTPLDFTPGMLGATLLLATLFRPREHVRSGYNWRAAIGLAGAFLLRPENALLFPAVLWAVSRHRGIGRLHGASAGLVLALATTIPLFGMVSGTPERRALGWRLLDTVLAGRAPSVAHLPAWVLMLLLGLGVSAAGIYLLLFGRRLPEETPAPKWMVPWCFVVLAPVVAGSPGAGPVGAYLLPAAALGVADRLTRVSDPDRERRLALALVGAQVALALGVVVAWRARDPSVEWRATARAALEPDDVVVATEPAHLYLARVRWGLDTFDAPAEGSALDALPAELADAVRAGTRRLVVCAGERADGHWPAAGQIVAPGAECAVLEEGALTPLARGARFSPRP